MRIYLHSDRAEKSATYPMHLSPASDVGIVQGEVPSDWKNPDGSAKQITIDFVYGAADVPHELGKYMVERGLANKSRLLRKVSQLFDRHGTPIDEVFDKDGQRVNLDTPIAA